MMSPEMKKPARDDRGGRDVVSLSTVMAGPPGPTKGRPEDKLHVPAIHEFEVN